MSFIALFFVAFVGAITPGPDILLVMRNTLQFGLLQGLKILSGIATGWIFFLSLLYFGFMHILNNNLIQIFLSCIGGFYLLFIAYTLLKKEISKIDIGITTKRDTYFKALLINLSNPKVILFFSVIITPFMQGELFTSLLVLFCGLSSAFCSVILVTAYFRNSISEKNFYIIDKICAILFIFFAFTLFYHAYKMITLLTN